MNIPLRKVVFSLGRYEFHPDASPEETTEMEDLRKKRQGLFHRWVEDVDTSRDIPYVKPMALVEDIEDGEMHLVEYDLIQFQSKL